MKTVRSTGRAQRARSRCGWWVALATILLVMLAWPGFVAASPGAIIFVTTLEDKISSTGGCSLKEAIYSANFDSNVAIAGYTDFANPHEDTPRVITTQCVAGSGDDIIVLPAGGVFLLSKIVEDADNPFGPTATPIVTSNITIEANGSLLEWVGSSNARAFSVGSTGSLMIENAYIKNFLAHGGNGGAGGAGGGMGAGGAIYVHAGGLVVENSTFEGNGAVGGDGTGGPGPAVIGGGGGIGGNGGGATSCAGAGGGGSRGNGESICALDSTGEIGSGGGGTVFNGAGTTGGFACGGDGGGRTGGQDAPCPGGGGGGGGQNNFLGSGDGGKGNYGGGGGGGGSDGGNGGNGGFGGGGGTGWTGDFGGTRGGAGGFGGGGGAASDGTLTGDGHPGTGGMFGGDANKSNGGGGAGLGGAIFNDAGNVLVENSTFTGNFVTRGVGGSAGTPAAADNGADAGGAIFTVNGHLTVNDVTINGNQSTGSGGGIVVVQTTDNPLPTSLTLDNTIIASNGANECSTIGPSIASQGAGNLVQNNDNCQGVVSSLDPLLGPLRHNGGDTPTMAISKFSPAFNAADPTTSLLTAQNGVIRPLLGGFDIGAFELCVLNPIEVCPGAIKPPPDTEPLIIQVSPTPSGGTTNPLPGSYTEPFDSVIVLSATPNNGYTFVSWTPNTAVPGNPSTTVTMDRPQTVTATFMPLPTTMAGNIIAKSGPQNARVWTLSLLNNGPGGAYGVAIPSFALTQTFGAACTPVIGTAFPLAVSDLAPGQTGTANVTIDFTGCAAAAHFTATFTFSANAGAVSGNVVRFNQFQ